MFLIRGSNKCKGSVVSVIFASTVKAAKVSEFKDRFFFLKIAF